MKESIHDSMYESSKTLIRLLDKIGDKLSSVVHDFQRIQSSRDRDRDRLKSRGRDNLRDNYKNRDRDRRDSRDYNRNRSRDDSRDRDDRGRDRSNSRDGRRNQQRSGTGQRYFDKNEFRNYCSGICLLACQKTYCQHVSPLPSC